MAGRVRAVRDAGFPMTEATAYNGAEPRAECFRAPPLPPLAENTLAKPPNFKQEKQRREDQQKKKNLEKQREQAARKEAPARPPKP